MKHRLRHPISAIREPFGTAGLIVACVALVAALGGTAFAAAKLNSTQKKEVEKIAKKFAGKPGASGAAGAQGPAGAKGDAGAAGANGKDGTNGTNGTPGTAGKSIVTETVNVGTSDCNELGGASFHQEGSASKTFACNGENGEGGGGGGEFPNFLPPEKSESGTWSIQAVENETGGVAALSSVSFGIPLEHAPTYNQDNFIAEGAPSTAACPGSAANPQAAPGNACLYELIGTSIEVAPFGGFTGTLPNGITVNLFKGGAPPEVHAEMKAGEFMAGTWAVTAPAE